MRGLAEDIIKGLLLVAWWCFLAMLVHLSGAVETFDRAFVMLVGSSLAVDIVRRDRLGR